jgi:hypothetical protein
MDDQAADGANDTEAASEPARPDPITGDLVTASFDYDGGRQVTVYVPADGPEAVVFAGDGQLISHWGGYLEAADLPPTMIVGAYRTDEKDETVRIHEYSPPFDAVRFAAHESFSSRMSADGCGRGSASRYPPNAPRYVVCQQAESSPWPWDFGIQTSTVTFDGFALD